MILFDNIYKNKTVLVTGDTGFKGSWLAIWLRELGANVIGYALEPKTEKDNYVICGLENRIIHINGDVRDYHHLKSIFDKHKPDIVFHMAAQALVLEGYRDPLETYSTNIMGTINVLEAIRHTESVTGAVIITTDKCYENIGKIKAYKENDLLGGVDPYSASKASAELIIRAYRESFFKNKRNCGISSARAGNVIGGGDWSKKRLIPDCIRSLIKNKVILLRNPKFNRPWQLVLEPLKGYLILAKKQFEKPLNYSDAWNFGPDSKSTIDVQQIVKYMINFWGKGKIRTIKNNNFIEHQHLQIDATKAKKKLSWFPTYNIKNTVRITTEWYLKVLIKKKLVKLNF